MRRVGSSACTISGGVWCSALGKDAAEDPQAGMYAELQGCLCPEEIPVRSRWERDQEGPYMHRETTLAPGIPG